LGPVVLAKPELFVRRSGEGCTCTASFAASSVLCYGGCGDKELQGHTDSPSLHRYQPVVSTRQSARLREERSSRQSMEAAAGGKRAYSIIVPTYNERLNVALIVYLIFKHLP
jgi:hypothetical protein